MKDFRDRQRRLHHILEHLNVWAQELAAWEIQRELPIRDWTESTPDGASRRIKLGEPWADRHGIHAFRSEPVDPQAVLAGCVRELLLDFGGEALVTLKDATGEILDRFGANPRHRQFRPLPQGAFVIEAEVAARSLFGHPNRAPQLTAAALIDFSPEIRALRRRLEVVIKTALSAKDETLARSLAEVGEIAVSRLRLPTATVDVGPRLASLPFAEGIWERSFEPSDAPAPLGAAAIASVQAAVTALDAGLDELRAAYPKQGKVLVTGHAHIDYVWLWPQPETVRKITRTFNSVVSLMAAYPEFRFVQSSSLYYDHIEEEDPRCLDLINKAVERGQWEPIGGMFVECDTNMPSAEAFARQFLLGQQGFMKRFGETCRTAWLPDTFGFTGAMPQIMRQAGIDTLVTIKVSWSETNRMPENVFHWQGNDGSRVLVHTFDAYDNDGYNMLMQPEALVEVWGKHAAKDLTDTVIATYGWGDGGGGPAPDQIEALPLLNKMPAIPTVEHGSIQDHIDSLKAGLKDAAVPVWQGEMYLEYHRATLTSQARVKQLNRRAENALVAAEALSVLDRLAGSEVAAADLDADWRLTLRNQFHDILPGSSIREAYEQTVPELEGVVAHAEAVAAERLAALASRLGGEGGVTGLAVANISGSAKPHWQVTSPEPLPAALAPQAIEGGYVAASDAALAPLSVGFAGAGSTARVTVDGLAMENDLVRVEIDAKGRIASLYDKRRARETVDGAANRIMVYPNDLPRNFDAWDIEPGFALGGYELDSVDSLAVTATGPHMAEITVTRSLSASRIVTRYRLWSNSARLDIKTDISWHDRRTYLRAAFPVNVLAESAAFDQAIGVTVRATHDNTTWQQAQFEACGHRFVSMSETDFGAALLSADKYGFSAKGNVMTLSLIRGPLYPDMLADEGEHSFTYALLPHDGRWWSAEVQAEADLLNDPLRFVGVASGAGLPFRPIAWDGLDARFNALKPAEDGDGAVLRVSEGAGRRGRFALTVPAGQDATPVDILEMPDGREDGLVTPFRMLSWHIG
ncbi:alpha-mannosidase [Oryzibacter oryziterrae]|uniref:alpha-mannosidase n=1 Tax=Oryzibacter oryziterrae TaxID=2766474 RepID=UPI001F35189A|nr:glycoside hydrolase family 38 C-terminal domain-containing protein [Oryzibacter oryziterrae]